MLYSPPRSRFLTAPSLSTENRPVPGTVAASKLLPTAQAWANGQHIRTKPAQQPKVVGSGSTATTTKPSMTIKKLIGTDI